MINNTFIFSKDALTDTSVQFDVSDLLRFGESLTNIQTQQISPVSTPALVVSLLSSATNPIVELLLQSGQIGVSYGMQVLITTSARQLTALVAVSVISNAETYTTQDPEAYTDLVDTIESGNSAIGTAVFSFPSGVDPSGGYVNWEFLDAAGIIYASGNAFDYRIQSNGLSNIVFARAIINVPSSVPASDLNSKYQLRYTLTLTDADQSTYYSYENVTVVGLTTTPTGTQDSIELKGNKATLSIVLDKLYDTVCLQLCADNTVIGQTNISDFSRVSSGYYFAGVFDTTQLTESLEPYTVVWNYSNSANPNEVFTESAALWIATPTIMMAISDVKSKVNKARATLYGAPDMLLTSNEVMIWLRRGRDAFNGAGGNFTTFTMTNAKGVIRETWLLYAEVAALGARYLAEGEKAFNFSGAAISLDVDRTSYLDAAASRIQTKLDAEVKPLKQNLIIKGATSGDGSIDPSKLQIGALGSVGITITPASPFGPYRSGLPLPGLLI